MKLKNGTDNMLLKQQYDSHGGQDKEHGEVDLDHHVNVLCVPRVGKVAARIEMAIFIMPNRHLAVNKLPALS